MPLTFNTSSLRWAAPEGQAVIKISNTSQVRYAIKIKTTNVDTYKTTPNVEFVDPGYALNLVVIREKSLMQKDMLAVNYVECESSETDAERVFRKRGLKPNVHMISMKCDENPAAAVSA